MKVRMLRQQRANLSLWCIIVIAAITPCFLKLSTVQVVQYLAGCGLKSCPMLVAKGYPDIGWNPVEGERYLDFLRFAVFCNGKLFLSTQRSSHIQKTWLWWLQNLVASKIKIWNDSQCFPLITKTMLAGYSLNWFCHHFIMHWKYVFTSYYIRSETLKSCSCFSKVSPTSSQSACPLLYVHTHSEPGNLKIAC